MSARTVTYKGPLTMLGNSTTDRGGRVYSVIEIGDDTIEDVLCFDKLDNYLQRALNHEGEVELEIHPKPTKGGQMLSQIGWFFTMMLIAFAVLALLAGMGVSMWAVGPIGVVLVLAFGFVLLGSISGAMTGAFPRYAGVHAISIEGKRYTAK